MMAMNSPGSTIRLTPRNDYIDVAMLESEFTFNNSDDGFRHVRL